METYFNFKEAKNGSAGKVINDVRILLSDVDNLLHETRGRLGARSRQELDAALEKMNLARRKLRIQARRTKRSTDQLVRARPYESLGIAAAAGFLIGLILSRK